MYQKRRETSRAGRGRRRSHEPPIQNPTPLQWSSLFGGGAPDQRISSDENVSDVSKPTHECLTPRFEKMPGVGCVVRVSVYCMRPTTSESTNPSRSGVHATKKNHRGRKKGKDGERACNKKGTRNRTTLHSATLGQVISVRISALGFGSTYPFRTLARGVETAQHWDTKGVRVLIEIKLTRQQGL